MIESTDEIYENIAANIRRGIAEPWERAELTIKVARRDVSYVGSYLHGDKEGPIRVSEFSRTLDDDLHKLHELSIADAHKATDDWNEVVFTLYTDGHYEIRFLSKTD